MKWFDNTALTLVIIGALNWLLVGIFKLDIVAVIFGNLTWISRIIYTIIGLCGLYLISLYVYPRAPCNRFFAQDSRAARRTACRAPL